MVMSWIWMGICGISILFSLILDRGQALGGAVFEGARAGVNLAISLTGSICLWSGVGRLLEQLQVTQALSRLLRPILKRLFPEITGDPVLAGHLSANICANLLGLGNAATPMGIAAAKRLVQPEKPGLATDSLCRLIVLNTASIQLLPTSVAAVRLSLGCHAPFDILPAVWITSFSSAGLGLSAAMLLGKLWPCD